MATRAFAAGNGFVESEALNQAFSYLVNSIDATALLPAAMSKKLITEGQRSGCASEPDPFKKADLFLGYLQRAVNGDYGKFHTFVQILHETGQDNIADELTSRSRQLTTTAGAIGDVKKEKAPVNDTDELPKHAKNEGLGERFPEMAEILAQFDELKNQMEDTMAENQPLINTHDDASNDSAATTATSEEAGAEWHAKFCSFQQQTQEKFEEQAKAIHDLEQLIHDSNKIQQIPTKELASKTLEMLKKFTEAQAKMSHSVEQLRTEQKRHGKILDEIPAIKSQLEKIQQASQAHFTRLEIDMIATQLKEKLQT